MIVIDPRKSETAMNADYWYGLKWKSDLLLLYTIANQLIEKDYLDHTFIAENTEANLLVFDPKREWKMDKFASKSQNSPFANQKLKGKVELTLANGKVIHCDME